MNYQVERFAEVIDEIKPLLTAHWLEIARHKDKIALNPDYEKYRLLDEGGMLHVVTVRKETKLVGYFVTFVVPHIHYKDHTMATNDILYVDPDYRGGTAAFKMFKYAETTLKDMGVTKLTVNMKSAHEFGSLLEHMGYKEIEKVYELMLK